MPTNFPTSLDFLSNPSASSSLASPSHAGQHADANDAIEALQAKVGVNNSAVTSSLDYKVRNPELVGGAARPLLTGGAYLDGTNGLVLSGLSGNYASTPDSAALSITGDIDIKVKATLTDWTPANDNRLVAKRGVAGQRGVILQVLSNGRLNLYWSPDGTAEVSETSTVATGITDNTSKWVRATLDVNDGAGNRVTKFYTSDDGTSWTQLGTTVTTVGTTSQFDNTASLNIGVSNDGAGNPTTGTISRAIIQSAYDTADNTTNVVFDADFAAQTADALAFTESSSNAATVTINTTRYTVGLPNADFGAMATTVLTINQDRFVPFVVTTPTIVDMIAFEVTAAPASNSTAYFGIYNADLNFQPTGAPVVATDTLVPSGSTGVFYVQITPVTLQPGAYLMAVNPTVTFTVRGNYGTSRGQMVHTLGSGPLVNSLTASRTAATYPTSLASWTGRFATTVTLTVPFFLRWKAA